LVYLKRHGKSLQWLREPVDVTTPKRQIEFRTLGSPIFTYSALREDKNAARTLVLKSFREPDVEPIVTAPLPFQASIASDLFLDYIG